VVKAKDVGTANQPYRVTSAYRSLGREIRAAILQNKYDGVRLPTEADLVVQYGVSRQTVRRAMQELVAEGMIYRVPGRGTFVTPKNGRYLRQLGSIEDLMAISADTEVQLIVPLRPAVNVGAARALRLDSDWVATTSFVRTHDGAPLCFTIVAVPPDVGQQLLAIPGLQTPERGLKITVVGTLEKTSLGPVVEADQSITAEPIPGSIAKHLGCAPEHPGLRIDRIYYNAEQRPIEFSTSYFLPEMYSYRVRLQRTVPH